MVNLSFKAGFISLRSSWALELMNKFMAASVWINSTELCNLTFGSSFLFELTDDTIVVVVLNSHRYVFDAEIHFNSLDSQESSLVVFLLIGKSFEVNFAANSFVVAFMEEKISQ